MKNRVPNALFVASKKVSTVLIEIMLILVDKEFIHLTFPNLMPILIEGLSAPQDAHQFTSLCMMKKLFKKYRSDFPSQDSINEMKYILHLLANLLLQKCIAYVKEIGTTTDPQRKEDMCTLFCLGLNVFQSLSSVDLPEAFEDALQNWLDVLAEVFNQCHRVPYLKDGILKTACSVLRVVNLYFEKYGEDIKDHVRKFYELVISLMPKIKEDTNHDKLVSLLMKFFSISMYKQSLNTVIQEKISKLIEELVYPNLVTKEEDIESFEQTPDVFISNDLEEADQETRRRNSLNLLRQLSFNYDITPTLKHLVSTEFSKYMQDTSKWQIKVNAINIIIGGFALQYSAATGAISVKLDESQFLTICQQYIFPEIDIKADAESINKLPYLKSTAIKFLYVFRNQIPVQYLCNIVCKLCVFLQAKNFVLSSYAASTIDKLMILKDKNNQPKIKEVDFGGYVANLLTTLAGYLNSGKSYYGLKILYRTITMCPNSTIKFVPQLYQLITNLLISNSKSAADSTYNYYLYECLALIIKHSTGNSAALQQYAQPIQSLMSSIIQEHKQELVFYAFQIHSLFLSISAAPSDAHKTIMNSLLSSKANWNSSMKYLIPSLVLFTKVFIQKQKEILQPKDIQVLVETFASLLNLRLDESAFSLAQTLVRIYPIQQFADFLKMIMVAICQRIQTDKAKLSATPISFSRAFICFLSEIFILYGFESVYKICEAIQPGLFFMIINSQVESLQYIEGKVKARRCIYAFLLLASEKVVLQNQKLWLDMIKPIIILASGGNFKYENDELTDDNFERMQYQQLINTSIKEQPMEIDAFNEQEIFINGMSKIAAANNVNIANYLESKLDKLTLKKFNDIKSLYQSAISNKQTHN